MKLIAVQPDDLSGWLPLIRWHLGSFSERSRGRHTVQHFIDGIRSGHMQCWIATDERVRAVCLTQVAADDLDTVLVTHCAGDDAKSWALFMVNICAWAKERGSKRVEATTRPGWERLLKPMGFKKTHVVLEVDV